MSGVSVTARSSSGGGYRVRGLGRWMFSPGVDFYGGGRGPPKAQLGGVAGGLVVFNSLLIAVVGATSLVIATKVGLPLLPTTD